MEGTQRERGSLRCEYGGWKRVGRRRRWNRQHILKGRNLDRERERETERERVIEVLKEERGERTHHRWDGGQCRDTNLWHEWFVPTYHLWLREGEIEVS